MTEMDGKCLWCPETKNLTRLRMRPFGPLRELCLSDLDKFDKELAERNN